VVTSDPISPSHCRNRPPVTSDLNRAAVRVALLVRLFAVGRRGARGGLAAIIAVLVVSISLSPAIATQPAGPTPTALTAARAWGVDAFSASSDTLTTLQNKMGRRFASYAVSPGLDGGSDYPNLITRAAIAAHGLIYLNINSAQGSTQDRRPYCYIDILHGRHDGLIDRWARAIVATHYANTVIGFQKEQSISSAMQPRCSTDTPAQYSRAYDYVFKRMRGAGVTAPFAWVPTAGALASGLADQYMPPAADFSVVGVDAYSGTGTTWRSASSLLQPLFHWQATKAPNKQLLIGEIGATETDARAPHWYAEAISLLKQHRNLLAVNWNVVADRASGRMYSPLLNDQTLAIWLKASRDPFFN
jgi:hypothetical protein